MQSDYGRVGRQLRIEKGPVVTYRAATLSDISHVGSNLRPQDFIEAYYQSHGKEPLVALRETFQASTSALAAYLGEEPIAVFGVTAQDDHKASPWMVATPKADRFPREMVSFGRQFTEAWLYTWDTLWNYVSADNPKAIRWLTHLGYTVLGPQPVGFHGAMFRLFIQTRRTTHVC